jgi:ribonuclease III
MEDDHTLTQEIWEPLFQKIDHVFKQPALLREAFQHSSYVNESGNPDIRDNERLEFLGDAVLDLAISHILMERFRRAKEGDLSKYRAAVVNEKGLVHMAHDLELGRYLLLGKGEEATHGREKHSILANTVEALLGALYLDAGFTKTKEVVVQLFSPLIKELDLTNGDHKSLLQEYTQNVHKTRPEYQLVHEKGPPHNRTFRVAVYLNGSTIATGEGKSKKEAEQNAAKEALDCLSGDPRDR